MDIPRLIILKLLKLFIWLPWSIFLIVIMFPINYLIFGWKRTVCSLIHNQLQGYGYKSIYTGEKTCSKCGLTYTSSDIPGV